MVRYWTNFAKYGEPSPVGVSEVPTWYPVTQDSKHYMELKAEPEAGQDLLGDDGLEIKTGSGGQKQALPSPSSVSR